MNITTVSNGHAVVKLFHVPAVPPNFDALANAALAMPNGIEQFNALSAIRFGHGERAYPLGGKGNANAARVRAANAPDPRISGLYAAYGQFAQYSAFNLAPNFLQAVDEYNKGLPFSQPWFEPLFATFNAYFKQGQAARGRMTAALGQAAIKQWIRDAKPGGLERTMDAVQAYVTIALATYLGGEFLGPYGQAIGRDLGRYEVSQEFQQSGGVTVKAKAPPTPPPPRQQAPAPVTEQTGFWGEVDKLLKELGL